MHRCSVWFALPLVACAGRAEPPPASQPAVSSSQVVRVANAAAAPSGSAVSTSPAPSESATSGSTTTSATTDICETLREQLGSSDLKLKSKAAIEASNANCSAKFYDEAMVAMLAVAKSLDGDDDSMMRAADTICLRTRHPATRKRAYDVYFQYFSPRFSDRLKALAKERYKSNRSCFLDPRPGPSDDR